LSSETAHPRVAIIDKRKIFWAEKVDSTRLDSDARGAKLSPRRFLLRADVTNTVDKIRAGKIRAVAHRLVLNRPARSAAMFCRSFRAAQPDKAPPGTAGPPFRPWPTAGSRAAWHKADPSGGREVTSVAADYEIMS